MKISDNFKTMHPLEYKMMLLHAAQGSTRIEGMTKAAEEIGKQISELEKKLDSEKNNL